MKRFSASSRDTPGKISWTSLAIPSGFGRTGHDGVDGDCRALGELGKTAGQRELHGLRRAVVSHLRRGADGGFAGDEEHAAGVLHQHCFEVMAG